VTSFEGFPIAALDFYDDLEVDNTKSFWEAHKAIYLSAVKEPMVALTDALEPEFGKAKVFRPFRDDWFVEGKSFDHLQTTTAGPRRVRIGREGQSTSGRADRTTSKPDPTPCRALVLSA
jgi:hypothetical protein